MKFYLTFCLLLGFSMNVNALGREISLDEVRTDHWGSISQIFLCGQWANGDNSGTYRIIHAEVYASSVLYVEWLQGNYDVGKWEVVHHRGFSDINNDHAEISITNLSCTPNEQGVLLKGLALSGHDDSEKNFEVQIGHSFSHGNTAFLF